MLLRIVLVTAALALGMAAVKDGRVLSEAGLVGGCTTIERAQPGQATWHACRPGRLEGRPDLSRRSCVSHGVREGVEYWRCPAPGAAPRTPST